MVSRASESMEGDKDRISTLPVFLIHQILSYLPSDEEAARTCVLSKTWLQFHSTSPNLTFNQSFYSTVNEIEKQQPMLFRFSFFIFVHNTLLRYQSLNLTIHKLKIILSSLDAFTSSFLDKSLRLAFDIRVQDLSIILKDLGGHCLTPLPSSMFEHPNALTSLTVEHFRFPENVIGNSLMFPFLKTLYLHKVDIDNEMIQKLLSCIPSLEKLVLSNVYGLAKFRVNNLSELKTIDIIMGLNRYDRLEDGTEKFEIDIEDAPSLCYLRFSSFLNMSFLFEVPFLLKVGSAPNLKVLELRNVNINDNDLKELMAKFPLLENFKIVDCKGLKRFDITSRSLRYLCLWQCGVVEAKIDAPSLLKLEHTCEGILLLSRNNSP